MERRLLHITDFHISNLEDGNEPLRLDFYIQFLEGVIHEVGEAGGIDDIVVTGDFVHRGQTENFPHATKVIDHLASELDVPLENVYVCPGNHDIRRCPDSQGKTEEARNAFYDFSFRYGGDLAWRGDNNIAMLSSTSDNTWYLMLDSTMGARGENKPGPLSEENIDAIINKGILNHVNSDDLLIIGSHHPPFLSPKLMSHIIRGPEYDPMRLWSEAFNLHRRLTEFDSIRKDSVNIWLAGDIHLPNNLCYHQKHYYSVAGRFGTRIFDPENSNENESQSLQPRQAKLITVKGEKISIDEVYQVHSEGRENLYDSWKTRDADVQTINTTEGEQPTISPDNEAGSSANVLRHEDGNLLEGDSAQEGGENPIGLHTEEAISSTEELANEAECVDQGLEKQIISRIDKNNLYSFGRFATSRDESSLAWIRVGELLNSHSLATEIIEKAKSWIQKHAGESAGILVGLDCWGAVLASLISVRTGLPNSCVALRGRGKYSTAKEELAEDEFHDVEAVIFVSDVIASGRSIEYAKSSIEAGLDESNSPPEWHAISVISDYRQQRKVNLDFLSNHGTCCGDLRIPTAANEKLPSESILPPDVDLR